MNRPIKFRVWHKKFKQWWGIICLNEPILSYDVDNLVFVQYTGCHDSSNKEIYEGDIVKYNLDKPNIERIGIIEFSNYYKGWAIKDSHCYPLSDFGVYSLASPFLSFNRTEIVGNIFEHSELLK